MGDKLPLEIDVRVIPTQNNEQSWYPFSIKSLSDSMEIESPRYCGDTCDDAWEDIWNDKVSGISGG
jgi:hypothetical protein